MNSVLSQPAPVTAPSAAWAFNEQQLQNALAHLASPETAESVMDFLHSEHARKLRIADGRSTGGLIAPRHRRVVRHGSIVVGGGTFGCNDLVLIEGTHVLAEIDPADALHVNVYSLSGKLLCRAGWLYDAPPGGAR